MCRAALWMCAPVCFICSGGRSNSASISEPPTMAASGLRRSCAIEAASRPTAAIWPLRICSARDSSIEADMWLKVWASTPSSSPRILGHAHRIILAAHLLRRMNQRPHRPHHAPRQHVAQRQPHAHRASHAITMLRRSPATRASTPAKERTAHNSARFRACPSFSMVCEWRSGPDARAPRRRLPGPASTARSFRPPAAGSRCRPCLVSSRSECRRSRDARPAEC